MLLRIVCLCVWSVIFYAGKLTGFMHNSFPRPPPSYFFALKILAIFTPNKKNKKKNEKDNAPLVSLYPYTPISVPLHLYSFLVFLLNIIYLAVHNRKKINHPKYCTVPYERVNHASNLSSIIALLK